MLTTGGKAAITPFVCGAIGVMLFLAFWQYGSTQVSTEDALPAVGTVFVAVAAFLGDPGFWIDVASTLAIAVLGCLIAAVGGVVLCILIGTSPIVRAATRITLEFLRPIPAIVILPLAMLLLGPTAEMGVFLVVFGVILPITAQTAAGVEAVDPVMRNTARSFGMGRAEILRRVVLPGAAPYIGTALRVAAPVTLVMTVVAGMLGGAPGLGNALTVAQIAGRNVDLFAYVVVLGILGFALQICVVRVERRVLHWHSSFRKERV